MCRTWTSTAPNQVRRREPPHRSSLTGSLAPAPHRVEPSYGSIARRQGPLKHQLFMQLRRLHLGGRAIWPVRAGDKTGFELSRFLLLNSRPDRCCDFCVYAPRHAYNQAPQVSEKSLIGGRQVTMKFRVSLLAFLCRVVSTTALYGQTRQSGTQSFFPCKVNRETEAGV